MKLSKLWLRKDQLTAILMLLPSLILIGVFVYGFIAQTAYSSFTDWEGVALDVETNLVGWENYQNLFTKLLDIRFRQSLVNTFFFTVFFIAGCLSLGLLFAILLDQSIRFEGVFRLIFLYPMSLSFIVSGTVWRWLLNPKGGINILPTLFGREPLKIKWLTDRTQIWQFDWLLLPKIFGYILLVVMILLAFRYFRNGRKWQSLIVALLGLELWRGSYLVRQMRFKSWITRNHMDLIWP
jgi:glucose/mannose transport system permease protein